MMGLTRAYGDRFGRAWNACWGSPGMEVPGTVDEGR